MGKNTMSKIEQAVGIFRAHGGTLSTKDALEKGVHPRILYRLRDQGLLETIARGLYRLADAEPLSDPDLVTVAMKVPDGVVCLISALSFHGITTQIPHAVDLALVRGAEKPRIQYPPVRIYWAVDRIYHCGIEAHEVDGVPIKVYSPEKTVVDCFRYRNKLGLDVALEALRFYRERKPLKVDLLMEVARTCRVAATVKPYLEAVL